MWRLLRLVHTELRQRKLFSFKNGQHLFLWKCSHGDLQQRQRQRCHHQLGSMPNCDGNGNDTVSFAVAAAQCERTFKEKLICFLDVMSMIYFTELKGMTFDV